jgi:hypothetical protein
MGLQFALELRCFSAEPIFGGPGEPSNDRSIAALRNLLIPRSASGKPELALGGLPLSSNRPRRRNRHAPSPGTRVAAFLRWSTAWRTTLDIRWRSGGPAEETGFRRVNRQPSRGLGCRTWTAALSSLSCCIRGLDSNSPRCQSTASHLVRPDSTRGTMAATPEQARACTTSNSAFPPLVHRCTSGPLCACSELVVCAHSNRIGSRADARRHHTDGDNRGH